MSLSTEHNHSKSLFLKGTTPEIKSPPVREKISIMGAMGMDNGQLITMKAEIFNADSFRTFVKRIIKNAKTERKILLVLDNARFHHAVINREFLNSVNHKIVLMYLPAYSPELNPIESFWKKTRRGVTHNRYFESLAVQGSSLDQFFNKFKKLNDILNSLSTNY
jgi:transposase